MDISSSSQNQGCAGHHGARRVASARSRMMRTIRGINRNRALKSCCGLPSRAERAHPHRRSRDRNTSRCTGADECL